MTVIPAYAGMTAQGASESPNLPSPRILRDSFAIAAIRGANAAPISQ